MKSTYSVTLEGTLPVIARIHIVADTESEATMLAERIAESHQKDVKTTMLEIEAYPADFLMVQDVGDVTVIDPWTPGEKGWSREKIETLLEK